MNDEKLTEVMIVARNPNWVFAIAKLGGRWIGGAIGIYSPAHLRFAVFKEFYQGSVTGLEDRDRAIALTVTTASIPDCPFGPADEWGIPKGGGL